MRMTSWGYLKHQKKVCGNTYEKGLKAEYTRKWRVTATVLACAAVVCNEDMAHPVDFSRKWGEDEWPIVDRRSHLRRRDQKKKKLLLGCTHIEKAVGKAKKAHVGKMDAILTDSHLGTSIMTERRSILMDVIVPKLEYAREIREGNAKVVKQLETTQMAAAAK